MKRVLALLLILCLAMSALPWSLADAPDDGMIVVGDAEAGVAEAEGLLLSMLSETGDDAPEIIADGEAPEDGESEVALGEPEAPEPDGEGAEAGDDPEALLVNAITADDPQALIDDAGAWEDAAAGSAVPDGGMVFEENTTIDSPADSDALFAGYVNRLLKGGRASKRNATSAAGRSLTGPSLNLYNALKPLILKVAAGEVSSAACTVPAATLLGGDTFTPEARAALYPEGAGGAKPWNGNSVLTALWLDCTYELYWFKRYPDDDSDKYYGMATFRSQTEQDPLELGEDGNYHVREGFCYVFKLAVLNRYAVQDMTYMVDTGKIGVAKQAAENARAIVRKYAEYSDYGKLMGYAREICALVDYNTDANNGQLDDVTNQDPWKLIWVFDGDPSTDVVCEGYAQAFQYLCELTGFSGDIGFCMVTGYVPEAHSWNLVRMDDGRVYAVDVTWMDRDYDLNGLTGHMADWIRDGKGRLFLCGGEGSASDGYKLRYRDGSGQSTRTYRQDTLSAYPASALALASGSYVLTGWQRLEGRTVRHCFDADGTPHAGWLDDGGVYYYLSDGGAICTGWQTIDETACFFEADGALHTVHTPVEEPAVAPTCEQSGRTEGSHCAVCGAVLSAAEVVPATGHTPVTDAAVAPTCTQKGRTEGSHCAVCGAVLSAAEVVPATGHTPVTDPAVAPTYTKKGLTEGSHCSVCGKVLQKQKAVAKLDCSFHMTRSAAKKVNIGVPIQIVVDGKAVKSYRSSNKKVATVNAKGWVTTKKAGTAKITIALNSGRKLTLSVTVVDPSVPTAVRITQGQRATMKAGSTLRLTAKVLPTTATTTLKWSSDSRKVATVSAKGVVRARRKGKATITVATANGKKAAIIITVK